MANKSTNTSPPVVNLIQITQEVEAFYLSGDKTGKLKVQLEAPLNDTLNINLKREKNFTLTLKTALQPVQMYLSNVTQVTSDKHSYTTTSAQERDHHIKSIIHRHWQKHCTVNKITGTMGFVNQRPHKTAFILNGKCKNY